MESNLYFEDINPIEKEEEIKRLFADYSPKTVTSHDSGYDWMADDSLCIVFENPHHGDNIEIELENEGEITLHFSTFHSHYPCMGDYETMLEEIRKILSNEACACLLIRPDGRWRCGGIAAKSDVGTDLRRLFGYDIARHAGDHLRFDFWDPADSCELTVPAEEE